MQVKLLGDLYTQELEEADVTIKERRPRVSIARPQSISPAASQSCGWPRREIKKALLVGG